MRYRVFASLLLLACVAFASDKPEPWLQALSPHFVVVTNGNEKQARNVAAQFERMRAVFHAMFPKLAIDAFAPITVIAARDEKVFRTLEPEAYLAKGALKLGGLFLHGSEKNYVLLRLDTNYDHPYAIVYHEYTHLLTSKASDYMPLWLNEGFAEFYQSTEIRDKEVLLGQFSQQNIDLLRQQRLLPLDQLFRIDHDSPYYHEQDKGSIFYAESWALTHYLTIYDFEHKTRRISDYLELLSQNVDPVTAATQAFGDLKLLQKSLDAYVRGLTFKAFKMAGGIDVNEAEFKIQPLTQSQSSCVRADFLAYNQRTNDAKALIEQVLKQDPANVQAFETLGYMAFRENKVADARKWFEQAVKQDSQSYLAHYYFAAMTMNSGLSDEDDRRVESSLRAAIKLNPTFAPAYDRLAAFYGMRHKNLEEAYTLSLSAVQYDPGNIWFRINAANALMANQRIDDAVRVLENALHIAKNQAETSSVQNMLEMVQNYKTTRERAEAHNRAIAEATGGQERQALRDATGKDEVVTPPRLASRKSPSSTPGVRKTLVGKLTAVQCGMPAVMDLKLVTGSTSTALHSDNYYQVQFSALGFTPEGELHPCSDIEGMQAKVEFVEIPGDASQIIAVELRK